MREHDPDELSHYSSGTADVEYYFPIGWSELEGVANRGNFDLTQHAEYSGEKLEYFDPQTKERYVPHVIEPAAGADRATLAFLVDAYDEDTLGGESRTVLKLHPRLAPVKVAVLPLVKKDGQPEVAREIVTALRARMQTEYDEGGSIGKRYRRQDEIGTPFCVTVDHQTLEDRTVTLRDRDTLEQERLPIDGLVDVLVERLAREWRSPKGVGRGRRGVRAWVLGAVAVAVLSPLGAGCGGEQDLPGRPAVATIVQDDAELLHRTPQRIAATLDDLRAPASIGSA